jgi:Amino acid kinase family
LKIHSNEFDSYSTIIWTNIRSMLTFARKHSKASVSEGCGSLNATVSIKIRNKTMRHPVISSALLSYILVTIQRSNASFLVGHNARLTFSNPRSLPYTTPKLHQKHGQVEDYKEGIHGARNADKDDGCTEVVMKFGGSSLADACRVDHVANLIKDQIRAGYRPRAVVCSAMGKTTNALLAAGDYALGTYVHKMECFIQLLIDTILWRSL